MIVSKGLESGKVSKESANLLLEGMGPLGDTFARFEAGLINVFGGITGEEVIATIVRYRRRRKLFSSAIVSKVLTPSVHRVQAPCSYFGACTGCQWQHIEYTHQLDLKRESVLREFERFVRLASVRVPEVLPAPNQFNYRNHARFTVRREGSVGYVNRITRRFLPVEHCMLMDPWINQTLGKLQFRSVGMSQISVRYGVNTGDSLIQPDLENDDIDIESGQTHYHESLFGNNFRIGSPSFFQVNTVQAEQLIEIVLNRLELTGHEILVDAFAGVGTFAVLFAKYVKKVIVIEESESAIKDAKYNLAQSENIEIRKGKTENVLAGIGFRPDVVILDPPRSGCQPEVLLSLVRSKPLRLVYVSCDPATLARDLNVLVEGGFKVEHVDSVDMFPQTYHLECVTTLSSDSSDD